MSKNKIKFCPQCAKPLEKAERGGRERRVCPDHTCGYVHWNNPAPVVAVIATREESVFLVRSHGWPENWFGLVTGFVERGETPAEAALRETKEELGLEGQLGELIGIYPFPQMNQLIIAYQVSLPSGPIEIDAEELAGYRQVAIEKVQPWNMGTGLALQDWLRSQGIERDLIPLNQPQK